MREGWNGQPDEYDRRQTPTEIVATHRGESAHSEGSPLSLALLAIRIFVVIEGNGKESLV
jgi:hypothetical protein